MYDVAALIDEPALREPLVQAVQGEPPSYLRSTKIKLTTRCNLRCEMCRYGRDEPAPELATERWLIVIDELAELGCRKLHLSGGEVLLRRDLETLIARARERRMKVTLSTNLTLLDKERAKALMRLKISGLSTSLDAATAKGHDTIRGIEGSFKRTIKALGMLERYRRDHRPRVRINFVMMRHNFHEYPRVIQLAAELGATDVVPMPVDSKRRRLRLSKRLIREYEHELAPQVLALRQQVGMPLSDGRVHPFGQSKRAIAACAAGHYAGGYYEEHTCYAPYLHQFVACSGEVYPCCMTKGRTEPLGDLSQQSVVEVFRGDRFQALRRQLFECRLEACHRCDMYLEENQRLAEVLPSPPIASSPAPLAPNGLP